MTCDPFPLHKPTQPAAEEELAPLQCVLLILGSRQSLAAAKLTSHGAAIVITIRVLKATPRTEQRPVQLQHRTARPAAHQGTHIERRGGTLAPGQRKAEVKHAAAIVESESLVLKRNHQVKLPVSHWELVHLSMSNSTHYFVQYVN